MKLFGFLMGLNELYSEVRGQILMMILLPSVNKAYSMIISDESQRATSSSYSGEETALPTTLYVGKDLLISQRQHVNGHYSSGGDIGASSSTILYTGKGQ